MAHRATPVTQDEMNELVERVMDLSADLANLDDRLRKEYSQDTQITTPMAFARAFSGLASRAGSLTTAILIHEQMKEERARIEAELKGRD